MNHEFGTRKDLITFANGNTTNGILLDIDVDVSKITSAQVRSSGHLLIKSRDPNAKMILHLSIDNSAIPDSAYLIGNGPFTLQNIFDPINPGKHNFRLLGFNEIPFELSGVTLTAHLSDIL